VKNLRYFILGGLLASTLAWGGTANLPQIITNIILKAHVNDIRSALYQDLVPRNASGTTTSLAGGIGTSTYLWLKARIASGYWSLGDIKIHHTYNGAAPIDEGWMLMDGRQVTQANYDTEHGSGHWATYVGSSSLLNKFLPNMTGKYAVGAATTTQSGSIAITFTGNASNQINIQHSHAVVNAELVYAHQSGTTDDAFYGLGDTPGTPCTLTRGANKNSLSLLIGNTTALATALGAGNFSPPSSSCSANFYTAGEASNGTGTALSATQSIQPESLQVLYYMRVID
jgi:hypothetical protein